MEYELFRSELKPSVDGALVSDIIRNSSSGLSSHRTAAIELILERSIQERRERMLFANVKNSVWPNSTTQPGGTGGALGISIPEVQSPVPTPAPQLPPQPPANGISGSFANLAVTMAEREASQGSSALSEPAGEINVARGEEQSADVKTDPPTSEDFVELVCRRCSVKQLRSSLHGGSYVYCGLCPRRRKDATMLCVRCGTTGASNVGACTGCHGRFK